MARIGLALCVASAAACAAAAPPQERPPRERPWIEQVERERDRGAGRIEDRPTWELQRLRDQQDVRAGRLREPREFERLDEERDRELRFEAKARRPVRLGEAAGGAEDESVILRQQQVRRGSVGPSPLATVVAVEQRELAEAKETLDRALRAVDAAEGRAVRALRRRLNREGRPEQFEDERQTIIRRREGLRAGHRRAYERVRERIVGGAPTAR